MKPKNEPTLQKAQNQFTEQPYLIAEAGVNYYEIAGKLNISLLDAARLMIKKASEAGVSAIKFQAYKAEKLATKESQAYWDTAQEGSLLQYELFKRYDKLTYSDYQALAQECNRMGIDFLCTFFHEDAIEALLPFVPAIKIASADITNKSLLKLVALHKKPIFLSTGASTLSEIARAVEWILEENCTEITLMHCVLSYPTQFSDANLGMIKHLAKVFPNCTIGYSDHCPPDSKMLILTLAFLYGATVIEKHFTLDKLLPGNDHYHAMDCEDIKCFLQNIRLIRELHGSEFKHVLPCEKEARVQARRSIVTTCQISKGQVINEEMLTFKRPGVGIPPEYIPLVVGRIARNNLDADTIILWNHLI